MFRQASRQKPGAEAPRLPEASAHSADFGTDLHGHNHTAREISDLVDNKQTQIDDVTKHVQTLPAHPDATWSAWSADWARFLSDWSAAASEAKAYVQTVKDNPNLVTAGFIVSSPLTWLTQTSTDPLDQALNEDLYRRVLYVLEPDGAGTSRLQDLYRRYTALPQATPIPFRALPKQYQKDEALETLKKLPNIPQNPFDPNEWLKKVPWWAWAAAGTLVLGSAITVVKSSPLMLPLKLLK
jgi:hypothetical protein